MDLNLHLVNAISYNLTDVLADVGGLACALFLIGGLIVGLFFSNAGQTNLVEQLYAFDEND